MRFKPILLQCDNFTPPPRTPWGGKKILNKYKALAPLSEEKSKYEVVGESWELSVEPDFPSLTHEGIALAEILSSEPLAMLGDESARGSTALLLKLLDSGENLSVQIHPSRDYPALKDGETGKAECWYVVDHEQGAGIYFGLRTAVDESRMRSALEKEEDISKLLQFVPVNRGDFFVIEPGTPHAIGGGVTLLEPQYVEPGCRGLTYRYWDWNRRYDAAGRQAVNGKPRQLHIEDALRVTDWNRSMGESLLATRHFAAGAAVVQQTGALEYLCGPEGEAKVRSSCIRAARLTGTGCEVLPSWNALRSLTVLEGEVVLGEQSDCVRVNAGQTVAIPACLNRLQARLEKCHAMVCAVYTPGQRR